MASITFTGVLGLSADGSCGCSGTDDGITITFEGGAQYYDRVLRSETAIEITNTSFAPLPLADDMTTVSLLSLLVVNGTTAELLIGAPPEWLGASGTFPTGFVGGETFSFNILTYNATTGGYIVDANVLVTFTSADQTAIDVRRRINAALALLGYEGLARISGTQLVIDGPEPGANKRLGNATPNATIGYAVGNTGANGTGTPIALPGVFLAQLSAIAGDTLWIKGPAWINVLVAGT